MSEQKKSTDFTCGYCGAEPGKPCFSLKTGAQCGYTHVDRRIQLGRWQYFGDRQEAAK